MLPKRISDRIDVEHLRHLPHRVVYLAAFALASSSFGICVPFRSPRQGTKNKPESPTVALPPAPPVSRRADA